MSLTTVLATAIVILGSIALVVVGNPYRWNMASPGYGRWTRIVGAVSVCALAVVAAWSRVDEPLVAALVLVVGVALAVGYVEAHKRLTRRLREVSGNADDA